MIDTRLVSLVCEISPTQLHYEIIVYQERHTSSIGQSDAHDRDIIGFTIS